MNTDIEAVIEGRERWCVVQGDCLDVMRGLPLVSAVVTDPPYGIGADEAARAAAEQRVAAEGKTKAGRGWKMYDATAWDRERPSREIFKRITNMRLPSVVWGGNYFTDMLPPSMGWLCWDKGQRDFSLADFELAWTSEHRASRCIVYARGKALADGRFHPTQKPIQVMQESINYLRLPEDSVIFDPFCGSGTTGIAAVQLGHRFIGIEREASYCAIARRRITDAAAQGSLFHV